MASQVAQAEIQRLNAEIVAVRKEKAAIVEAAFNVARDRDAWRAAARRLMSDRACVV